MTLDELFDLWTKDCEIDRTELGQEALKISKLHSKYFKLYSTERLTLRKLEQDLKVLRRQSYEYFNGTLDHDEMLDLGWDPNPLKILRADVPSYVDSSKDIIDLTLKIAYQQEKVDFVENCVRSINARGYNLKAAIDWEKFKVGM
jgi:hypothetical protein